MIVTKNLESLAEFFKDTPLYLVGGRVRNFILFSKPQGDFDICSAMPPRQVIDLLEGSRFKVSAEYKRFGTLLISCKSERYEYTCFRKDSYKSNSGHCPDSVQFTTDITEDARRRDFKANALYFDILKKEIIDPTGGIADLAKKVLTTADKASKTFSEDGLRVLRLVRFAAQLDFEIEPQTKKAAIKNAKLLKNISPERKRDELIQILNADQKYKCCNAHYRGLKLLEELSAWQYILPPIAQCQGVEQNSKHHRYNIAEHTFQTVKYCKPTVRLAALMHDCAKAEMLEKNGNMHNHEVCGEQFTKKYLSALKFDKKTVDRTARLVRWHMYDLDGCTSMVKIRQFIADNYDIIDDLIELKRADAIASGVMAASPSADRLQAIFMLMKQQGIPTNLKQLEIDGNHLIEMGAKGKEVGEALKAVMQECLKQGKRFSKEEQLVIAKSHLRANSNRRAKEKI